MKPELERREWSRLPLPIPIFVRSHEQDGKDFLEFATALNISAGGSGAFIGVSAGGTLNVAGTILSNVSVSAGAVENVLSGGLISGVSGSGTGVSSGVATSVAASSPADYLARLPHRDPFRFVSQVTQVREGEAAEGVWTVTGDEPFFAGHFPGNPLVPGVLIAEALAQISGLASPTDASGGGMLAHADVRFDHPVTPPAQIILRSKLTRTIASLHRFDVSASVNGVVVASGSITLHRGPGGGA